RRHTRFSRDWSSDVCSSDLVGHHFRQLAPSNDGEKVSVRGTFSLPFPLYRQAKVTYSGPRLRMIQLGVRGQTPNEKQLVQRFPRSEERRVGTERRKRVSRDA